MKWISHKLTTFTIYYTLSGNPIQSLIASASSILDVIEFGPGKLIFRKHRGASHNPLFWAFALATLYLFAGKWLPDLSLLRLSFTLNPEALFSAIGTGVALHLLSDSLSGSGIPLFGNKRIALRLYKTFTLSEFVVVSFVLLSCGVSFAMKRFF